MTSNISLKTLTGMMNRLENLIAWYNRKYNFDVPASEKKYHSALNTWDMLKTKRDAIR